MREAADTNSKALEVADQGKTYQVDRAAQAQDGWIAVVCDSQTGYIAADYATRSLNTRVGITIEEEQAQIAAQKEAERKAAEEMRPLSFLASFPDDAGPNWPFW